VLGLSRNSLPINKIMIAALNSSNANTIKTSPSMRNTNRSSLASTSSRDSFVMKLDAGGFDLDFDLDFDSDMPGMGMACIEQESALLPGSLSFDDVSDPPLGKLTMESDHLVRSVTPTKGEEATPVPQPLLHRLCQAFPTNASVIQTALILEPEAVRQPVSLPLLSTSKNSTNGNGKIWAFKAPALKSKATRKDYQYPINIAINNGASCDVIQVLAFAAPEVLIKPEGVQGLTTLQIALLKQPKNHKLVETLLHANPAAATILTNHQNTLLHMACQRACPLSVVRAFYKANPRALQCRNFHGETPVTLAQRTISCPDDVLNYLQAQL
jgi:hypothetical protein